MTFCRSRISPHWFRYRVADAGKTVRWAAKSLHVVTTAVAVVALAALYGTGRDTQLRWPPEVDHSLFSIADSLSVQYAEPLVGVPNAGSVTLSDLFMRLVLLVPGGSAPTSLQIAAALSSIAAVLLTFALLRGSGAGRTAAIFGAATIAFSPILWSRATATGPDMLLAPLLLGVLRSGHRWADAQRPAFWWIAVGLLTLGIGSHPVLIWLAPVLAVLLVTADRPRKQKVSLLLGLVAGVALAGVHRWLSVRQVLAGAPVEATSPGAATDLAASSFVTGAWLKSSLVPGLAETASMIATELGVLGTVLLVIGGARSMASGRQGVLLAGSWLVVVLWVAVSDWPVPYRDPSAALLLSWVLVAVGVVWFVDTPSTARARAIAALVVCAVPVLNLTARDDGGWRGGPIPASALERFLEAVPRDAVIVSEAHERDRGLAFASAVVGAGLVRVPQDPRAIRRAHAAGRQVFALRGARNNLNFLGLRFASFSLPPELVTLREWVRRLPAGTIVAVAGGPRLWPVIPLGQRPFGPIGGRAKLFGQPGPFYGVIGVKDGAGLPVERLSGETVTLTLQAGDDVGTNPTRLRATITIVSDVAGGSIQVNGEEVARTRSGVAIAAWTPAGELLAAHGVEPEAGLMLPAAAPGPSIMGLIGFGDCLEFEPGVETELPITMAGRGIGGLVGSGLVVYATSRNQLRPMRNREPSVLAPLRLRSYEIAVPDELAALQAALGTDGVTDVSLARAPFVLRIEVAPQGRRAVYGLVWDGFADRVYLRWASAGPSSFRRTLCDVVVGEPLFAGDAPAVVHVPMRDETLVGGWHQPEETPSGLFRWTSGAEADLSVNLAATGAIRIRLEASSFLSGLGENTWIGLRVNDTELETYDLPPGRHPFAWTVPADVWHLGMNRVTLRTGAVGSPMAYGFGLDSRLLGIAVRNLQLELLDL